LVKNVYIGSFLKVTDVPIAIPSRSLNPATDLEAVFIVVFCPTININSSALKSNSLEFFVASPTPLFTEIFISLGTCSIFL
jgi:hypothetical protein